MREIHVSSITEAIASLCASANRRLPDDLAKTLEDASLRERSALGRRILCDLCRNLDAARELDLPICQDTGMAVVFAEIGQEVHLVGGSLRDAVDEGVRQGYDKGLLRKSVVGDPLRRVNTGDNTPAILHTSLVPGDRVTLTVAPKGFGSENMSGVRMMTPSATREDVIAAVVELVKAAGSNPCPPMVIGVGLGGDFEYAALLAKKALCRPNVRHADAYYAALEEDILAAVNRLNIGPQGFGGDTTALYVNVEPYPTHIAGLPVAVNIGCHVTRHQSITL